jgi:hypothetical protein
MKMKRVIALKLILFFCWLYSNSIQAQSIKDCKHPCEKTRVVKYGAFIGVKISDIPGANHVFVLDVLPNTAAFAFGLQPMDIITHLDDVEMRNTVHLLSEVAKKQPGEEVKVNIQRGGRTMTYEFPLGAQFTKTITETVCCDDTIEPKQVDILLSPIPAKDVLSISINEHIADEVQLSLMNSNGNTILSEIRKGNPGHFQTQLDIHHLRSGSYILKIKIGEQHYVKRFEKE